MTKQNLNRDSQFFSALFSERLPQDTPCYFLFHRDARQLGTLQRNTFVRLCKVLVRHQHYGPILGYVHDIFCNREEMDLVALQELLSEVNVRQGYTLAQLCQDYLRDVHASYLVEFADFADEEPIAADVDLFRNCPEDIQLQEGNYPTLRQVLPRSVLKHVFGMEREQLCAADVDAVVALARQQAQAAHDANYRWMEDVNRSSETKGRFQRLVPPQFTDYQRDMVLPGVLTPIFMAAELRGDAELCYYLLENYLFPTLTLVPWEEAANESLPIFAKTVYYCAEYLESLMYHTSGPLKVSIFTRPDDYLSKTFYYEALGKGDRSQYRYVTDSLAAYCHRHATLFSQWAQILRRGGKWLTKEFRLEGYSFHVLNTAFLLFFSGQVEEAADFFLKLHKHLDTATMQNPQFRILLVRYILSVPRLETANALYGLFSYELDRTQQDRGAVRRLSLQMIRFMQEARAYILENNQHTIEDRVPWFHILFGTGAMDQFLEQCAAHLDSNDILPGHLFAQLRDFVRAFSYPTGIHLAWLGLKNRDNYDKLPGALPQTLVRQGQACYAQAYEAQLFYDCQSIAEPLRNINLHLQNHLYKLQCRQVKENLLRVNALKKSIPEDMDEAHRERLLEEIGGIAKDLMDTMQSAQLGRPEIERKITALREDFVEKYLGGDVDLMQKLPEQTRRDVHNYLVTSNLVFQMMSAQNDESLDYSAALISMTKALELVMAHIYSRLDIKEYPGMKDESREYYFEKDGTPKKVQTLRPCIEVLKGMDRFDQWGGHAVLDLRMLDLFADIQLRTGEDKLGQPKLRQLKQGKKHMGTNAEVLMLALMYICNNYRNRSAHTDVVTITHVQECQQLLIDGQKLLWIVLAIMK